MKVGVLLIGFGGPNTLSEVRPFLYRLFADPAILVGIPTPFRQIVAWLISRFKAKESIENYRVIGGGSPQLMWTLKQAMNLRHAMDESPATSEVELALGMRLSEPSICTALKELKQKGVDQIILLPLFPQFSTTTTGSCFDEVKNSLQRLGWQPPVTEISEWCDFTPYINLFSRKLRETLANLSPGLRTHVIFSAHSLPLKIVERGDPYPQHVERTVRTLALTLTGTPYTWSLAFQSRNGKLPWLQPYLEDEIPNVVLKGVQQLVVVPLSFVSDHIETLWELDRLYADVARRNGITEYHRVATFNDDPEFGQVLEKLISLNLHRSSENVRRVGTA